MAAETLPAAAPEPQPVLSPLTASAIFLVVTVDPGGEEAVRDLLADLGRAAPARTASAPRTAG